MSSTLRALRSTRVVVDGQVVPKTIVLDGQHILSIHAYQSPPPGVEVEDLGDLMLMAGLTDVHVHVNEPGRTDWEGFVTATAAAAAGGVTTFIDMPLNSTPVTTTAQAFEAKIAAAGGSLAIDVGFWGGVVPADIDRLPGLLASGVLGLKAFLVHSGIEDFPNVTAADLIRALPMLAPTGLPLLVHCELDTSGGPERNGPADVKSYRQYLAGRPDRWEVDAIGLVIDLCRRTGARIHVVHLSSAEALPLLRSAKAEGLPITVETCPHYLVLDAESIPDGDPRYKCAPPIRSRANRDQLWSGLAEGTIDFVATDHSPCPPDLKHLDTGDLIRAWGGIASVQFLLPLVWTEARNRGFTVAAVEQWLCTRPAVFAGYGREKGRIAPGYRADLVAWDPDAPFSITPETIVYRHKITPFGGRVWQGVVHKTWLGGELAWNAGRPAGARRGRPLIRIPAALNGLSEDEARHRLMRVCASRRWVDRMLALRPFQDFRALAAAAEKIWGSLTEEDWLEAFAAHPQIGERYRNNREQAGVVGASEVTLRRLAEANQAYLARFGFVFLVFATGKTADQMLGLLETRLGRTRQEELATAAEQHRSIMLLRLAQIESAVPREAVR